MATSVLRAKALNAVVCSKGDSASLWVTVIPPSVLASATWPEIVSRTMRMRPCSCHGVQCSGEAHDRSLEAVDQWLTSAASAVCLSLSTVSLSIAEDFEDADAQAR